MKQCKARLNPWQNLCVSHSPQPFAMVLHEQHFFSVTLLAGLQKHLFFLFFMALLGTFFRLGCLDAGGFMAGFAGFLALRFKALAFALFMLDLGRSKSHRFSFRHHFSASIAVEKVPM